MPSGVHLRDARQQLFDAAELVLLRDGPSALTSRAVTAEAGCAKGVLHRHFADFDVFLEELVLDRMASLHQQAEVLLASVGSGSVVGNLTAAFVELFGPTPVAIIPLITFRAQLRANLRKRRPQGGVAILAESTDAVIAYLAAERDQGRIVDDADTDSLAMSLVGGGHLLFSDPDSRRPDRVAVGRFISATLERSLVGGST